MYYNIRFKRQIESKELPNNSDSKMKQSNKLLQQIIKQLKNMNAANGSLDFVKFFKHYIPLSSFDIEKLRQSDKTILKLYKESVYYGQFKDQKREGKGIMIYDNGRVYEGEWENNQKNNKGFERFSNSAKYTGEYKNGKPEGKGMYSWANGEHYEGEWREGYKHGVGQWKGSEGDFYKGQWKFGKADGEGTHVWLSGDKYQGQWKECLKHGFGRQEFANGDLYIGNYCKGKPSGYGEYYWKNGSSFKGNFKGGLRHGKGIWMKMGENSDMYEGMYADDKKCGYGVFTWINGNMYKGSYFDDQRHGYGEMYWKGKCCYKGNWENGIQVQQNKTVILEEQSVSEGLEQESKQLCSKTHFADQQKRAKLYKKQFNKTAGNFKNFNHEDIINHSKLNDFLLQKYERVGINQTEHKHVKRRKLKTKTSTDWFPAKNKVKSKPRTSVHSSISQTKNLKNSLHISQLVNTFHKPVRHKTASSKTQIKDKTIHSTFDLTKSLQNHVHCQQSNMDQIQKQKQKNTHKIPHSSFYLYRMKSNQKGRSFCEDNPIHQLQQKRMSTELKKPGGPNQDNKTQVNRNYRRPSVDKNHHFRQYSFSMKQ